MEVESNSGTEALETDEAKPSEESAKSEDHDAKRDDGEDETVTENEKDQDSQTGQTSKSDSKATEEETAEQPADIPNVQDGCPPEGDVKVQNGATETNETLKTETTEGAPAGDGAQQVASPKPDLEDPSPNEERGGKDTDKGEEELHDVKRNPPKVGDSPKVDGGPEKPDSEAAPRNEEDHAPSNEAPAAEDVEVAKGDGDVKIDASAENGASGANQNPAEEADPKPLDAVIDETAETSPGENPEPYLGTEQGARAASEAFIENAVLEAAKTPVEEKATRVRSKSKKRKQAARMKAAMGESRRKPGLRHLTTEAHSTDCQIGLIGSPSERAHLITFQGFAMHQSTHPPVWCFTFQSDI